MKYPLGEDQVMYYKMYLSGLKQLTWFHCGIKHLDAESTMVNEEKEKRLIYSDFYFKTIFGTALSISPTRTCLAEFGALFA